MEYLIELRNQFFMNMGKYRITRILTYSFVIAMIWSFADIISGSYEAYFVHDLMCLGFGVIAERITPWGKNGPHR